MLERTIIAVVFFILVGVTVVLRQRHFRKKKQKISLSEGSSSPLLMYIWSDGCSQCLLQDIHLQAALQELQQKGKVLRIRKIHALEAPSLHQALKVYMVPTTILFDRTGTILHWNSGFTPAAKIIAQSSQVS